MTPKRAASIMHAGFMGQAGSFWSIVTKLFLSTKTDNWTTFATAERVICDKYVNLVSWKLSKLLLLCMKHLQTIQCKLSLNVTVTTISEHL